MGFFSENPQFTPINHGAILPVDLGRISALLNRQDIQFEHQDDVIIAGWEEFNMLIAHSGESDVLNIRVYSHTEFAAADLPAMREFVNEWNNDYAFPKVIVLAEDKLHLVGELAIDHRHGATDDQVLNQIFCALNTSNQVFEAAASKFQAV